ICVHANDAASTRANSVTRELNNVLMTTLWENGTESRVLPLDFDRLQGLLRFAVFAIEMKPDLAASALLRGIDHAGIERPRIYMQADGALVELARIHHPMHRVGGINGAWLGDIHLDNIQRLQMGAASGQIL